MSLVDTSPGDAVRAVAIFFKVWGNVPQGSILIFRDTLISPVTQCSMVERNLYTKKISLIRSALSIPHRRVTDRQTDRQTHIQTYDDSIYRASIASCGKNDLMGP